MVSRPDHSGRPKVSETTGDRRSGRGGMVGRPCHNSERLGEPGGAIGLRRDGLLVDPALGDARELLVRLALLVQRLLQELGGVVLAEALGEGAGAAVAGNFVML